MHSAIRREELLILEKAHRFYSTAKGFTQSAYLMMSNPLRAQLKDDTSFVLGFHHLTGFSVELYLKSFLLRHGLSELELSNKKYGHKLHVLQAEAETKGLSCPAAKRLRDYFEQHGTLEYRYMKDKSSYPLRPLDEIFDDLSELDITVDQAIGASESKGLTVGQSWKFPQDGKLWWFKLN